MSKRFLNEEQKAKNRERVRNYVQTPIGRASNLLGGYKREDKKYDRGECDLTKEWIVENILFKPCAHCGKTGWKIIGCNRLDNSKPHTMDNVEPCCLSCNCKIAEKKTKMVDQILPTDGEIIKTWRCVSDVEKEGFNKGAVAACCRNVYGFKTHKGYIWKYK